MSYTVHTFDEDELGPVARFLRDFSEIDKDNPLGSKRNESEILENLKNRLASNPARSANVPLGLCLKDHTGKLNGTLLIYPWRFRHRNQVFWGLGEGALFVDALARPHGISLFRRYLDLKACDFHFAVTNNQAATSLWVKFGGVPLATSGYEYLFPIDIAPMAQEFAIRKGHTLPAALFSALSGKLVNPVSMWRSATSKLTIQQTHDWEKVASIAEKNRDPDSLVCDRSIAYLEWSYSKFQEINAERKVFIFETKTGQLGWFSMGWRRRGSLNQIYTARLLDWSIPDSFDFNKIVGAALQIARSRRSHLLAIQARSDLSIRTAGSMIRHYEAPRASVRSTTHDPNSLADKLIISVADVF